MITADKVKSLNKKIEELNAQSTKAKAKVEVLEGNLNKSLDDYQTIYGVSLRGKTMTETVKNIQAELDAVGAEAEKEFELRNAVVNAIERGDIEEANRLLGVEVAEPEEEEAVEEAVEEPEDNEDQYAENILEEVRGELEEDDDDDGIMGGSFGIPDDDDDDSFGIQVEDDEDDEMSTEEGINAFNFGNFNIEDDEPVHKPVKSEKKKGNSFTNLGSSVDDTVSSLESDSYEGFNMTDDDFEDFGLGDMLSGTKFEID